MSEGTFLDENQIINLNRKRDNYGREKKKKEEDGKELNHKTENPLLTNYRPAKFDKLETMSALRERETEKEEEVEFVSRRRRATTANVTASAPTNAFSNPLSLKLADSLRGASMQEFRATLHRPTLWTPLFWSILPYLLTKCFGYADLWSELCHLLLSLFWLYLALKLPWDFYLYLKRHYPVVMQTTPTTATTTGTPNLQVFWCLKFLHAFAILFIFMAPSLMLYLIELCHFDTSATLTVSAASVASPGQRLQIINPQVFLVITLFNPIRYFFGNQPVEDHSRVRQPKANLKANLNANDKANLNATLNANDKATYKSIEGSLNMAALTNIAGPLNMAVPTPSRALEQKILELQECQSRLQAQLHSLQDSFSAFKLSLMETHPPFKTMKGALYKKEEHWKSERQYIPSLGASFLPYKLFKQGASFLLYKVFYCFFFPWIRLLQLLQGKVRPKNSNSTTNSTTHCTANSTVC